MGQPLGRRSLAKKPYALLAGRRGIRRQLVEQGAQPHSSSRLTMLTPKEAARQSWRRTGLVLRSSSRRAETVPLDSQPSRCRSEEHTSELQSHLNLVCRLLLEKKKRRRST